MGRWHRLPPRPGRLYRRPHPQLSGRHPISPFTVHTPEPGDYGDGDPRTAGADDAFPDADCAVEGTPFTCCGAPNLCGGPHGTADDPGCYEETEYGPHDPDTP